AGTDASPLHAPALMNGVWTYTANDFPTNTYRNTNYWVDVVFSPAPPPPTVACPCTLWSAAATPTIIDAGDPTPVELGIRFQSDVAGYVTALRFYKSAANTGPHVGQVWSSAGVLLASVAFGSETPAGWQQMALP